MSKNKEGTDSISEELKAFDKRLVLKDTIKVTSIVRDSQPTGLHTILEILHFLRVLFFPLKVATVILRNL